MTRSSPPTTLRASGVEDLLTVVPYLLGYQPHESLVVAVLKRPPGQPGARRRVQMCARLDLAGTEPTQLVDGVRYICEVQQATAVVLLTFGADRAACGDLLDAVQADLATTPSTDRVEVVEAVHTDGTRWWSRTCLADCCPAEGTPFDLTGNRIAAEAVYAGLSVAGGREAIAASVAGPEPADWPRLEEGRRQVVEQLLNSGAPNSSGRVAIGVGERQAMMQSRVRAGLEAVAGGGALAEDDRLALALLAQDVHVRDAAWSMITPELAELHVRLWRQVVDRAVPELACAPLCLVGVAAWISGNGTLQMCCVERVVELDEHYSMADLLAELNAQAAPPSLWAQIAPGLRAGIADSMGRAG